MHLPHESNLLARPAENAEVAELVDALGSGSSGGSPVGVRVSPSAPRIEQGFAGNTTCKPFLHSRSMANIESLAHD
jgi:hypothetical protein